MADLPERLSDELGAYPLRLNVSALPERRFFKMTRTLTIITTLLAGLMIVLGALVNYQITHQDVSVGHRGNWRFYRIDPEQKRLKRIESLTKSVPAVQIVVEEELMRYLKIRNSTVWATDLMDYNFGASGPIAQFSSAEVFDGFSREARTTLAMTRGEGLIRDVHVYDLQLLRENLWVAIIETFDLPITDDLISECVCSDNSKACLKCKTTHAKRHNRMKVWMRTALNRGRSYENPLGIRVTSYEAVFVPIHENATYWDLPPALRPEI